MSAEGVGAERSFGGRFRSERLLKTGQGIETHLGTDVQTAEPVVIKSTDARTFSSGAAMRLEHEAALLRHLTSPLFAPLLSFGRDAGSLYLVMPFVPGVTLSARIARCRPTVLESLALGRALLGALAEAHDHGVLHRDVKPANLIVADRGPIQGAVLIDFGLARSARLDAAIRDQLVGTALYISPEQAGLVDEDVDGRSDLYSAGVVLYECLTGHPPFRGERIAEVLRMHLSVRPAELRTLAPEVPRALDEIVQRLLRKDPRDRYQTARAALFDLDALAAALARGERDPALAVGAHDERRTLTEPAFVGRRSELARLASELERARRGAGGLTLLEARSGGGKTRLLDELALQALRAGATVLRGQGLERAAQRPFQLLVGVAADLARAAASEPGLAARLRKDLGDSADAAAAALPELRALLETTPGDAPGPETFGEARTLRGLVALLDALGTPERPALVLLDDVQWADGLTLKLLAEWARGRQASVDPGHYLASLRRAFGVTGLHAMVIVAFRSEEAPPGHALRTLTPALALDLPPLPAEEVRLLAASMAGPLPDSIHELTAKLSDGSPFMVSAVLRGLVESGALVAEPEGWRVEPLALAEVRSSRHAAAFLARRIELLPPDAIALLEVGAVLGKEFDLELAAPLAEQDPARVIAAIDEARRRHILWTKDLGARCAFVHDRLREALLGRVPPERLRALHRAAAQRLVASAPARVFEIAYHFDAAGDFAQALPYALAAAERARAQHALGIAEEQYRIAERGAGATDANGRRQIYEGLGDVLLPRGRYEEAARALEAARELTVGPVARAAVEGKLGEVAFKRGDMGAGNDALERALRELGRFVPRRPATFLLLLLYEVAIQALHTLFPRTLGRRPLDGAEVDRLALYLLDRLTYVYWFKRGPIPTLWAHLRSLNLAERYPPTSELAQVYSTHAPVMSVIPLTLRGIDYAERSFAIRRSLGDLWGQGQSLNFHGLVLYGAGRYEECIAKNREAARLLERTGDFWEAHVAHFHVAASLYQLGDLPGAIELAKRTYEAGIAHGDGLAAKLALDVWSRASGGQVPGELIRAELARPTEDMQSLAQVAFAEAVRLLAARRPEEAVALLEATQVRVVASGVMNAYVLPLLPWLATALRRAAEAVPSCAPREKSALLRRARACARRAVWNARISPNDLAHALRERGLLAAMQGRPGPARRFLDGSLAVAGRLGQRLALAETRFARGRVGAALGWPEAAADTAAAREELAALGASFVLDEGARPEPAPSELEPPGVGSSQPPAASLSLADRFDAVLDAGRLIASGLSRTAIHEAVRESALKLLRGERCVLFEVGEGETLTPVSGEIAPETGLGLVRRAVNEGRIVSLVGGASVDSSESFVLEGVRSALAAPILVRGRLAACFCVTHREVGGLIGADEERLAAFIAAIAGAALENAAGFAAVQALSEEQARLCQEAQDAVRARDEFLSIASHELRTPLTTLGLQLSSLERGVRGEARPQTPEQLGARFALARRQMGRFQKLIDGLLDVSRIVEGRLRLELEEVDLAEVVRDARSRFADEAERARCELTVRGEAPVSGRWDRLRLEQIVTNLLANAIKFGAGKPVEVELSNDAAVARLCVRDHGIGIALPDQARIFERFERAVSMQRYGGLGLGLWITHQIVAAMGGQIRVESRPGEGSAFTVELPRLPADEGPAEPLDPDAPQAGRSASA